MNLKQPQDGDFDVSNVEKFRQMFEIVEIFKQIRWLELVSGSPGVTGIDRRR